MSYLERAITDGHAKFTGDPNNDIQPVSKAALIGAIKKCHQTLWAGGKLSRQRLYEPDDMNPFPKKHHASQNRCG